MTIQLLPQTQDLVDALLFGDEMPKRSEALKSIVALPDKDQVESYLIEHLDSETNRWNRTWSISALAEIGLAAGMKVVLEHTTNPPELDAWVRHFALINAANFTPFPTQQIAAATNDDASLPKATALRLLLANGQDACANELLEMLLDTSDPDVQWAVARVLRNRSDIKMRSFRDHIEAQFIEPLVKIASDTYFHLDLRWEAIQTLATFTNRKNIVAARLGELLIDEKDVTFRRYYMQALITLDQPEESKAALLKAVEDEDAQIRMDSARALKKMLGAEKSIQFILPHALERETDSALLVDALRHIDPDLAAKVLRDALSSPDVKVSSRANRLLTELGGQTAAQILMGERTKALDNYTHILSDADKDVRTHFIELMSQAKFAFWLSLFMHVAVFLIGVWMLIASLSLALKDGLNTLSTWIGVGGAGASALAILLTTFYRNPLRNIRTSLNSLMQTDVVFLGYVRQINQIDATFKHMFIDAVDFGSPQMKETVAEIQSSVKVALDEIQKQIDAK